MDEVERLFTVATMAVSLVAIILLIAQRQEQPQSVPLALFLVVNAVTDLDPLLERWLEPSATLLANVLVVPCFLLLAPLFWSYIRALTVETQQPWRLSWRHLLPVLFGLLLTLPILLVDPARRLALADGSQALNPLEVSLLLGLLLSALAWVVQAGFYLAASVRRVVSVRLRLRDWFSNTQRRELNWVTGLIAALSVYWLLVVIDLLGQLLTDRLLLNQVWLSVFGWLVVVSVAVFGLRQQQVFQREQPPAPLESTGRYERSALTDQDSARIADKLAAAMSEGLYTQPSLSLRALSDHLGVSTNYLSQVLNQSLGESFFEYINRHRVEAALPRVAAGEEAIADIAIAVGFNSRSSFYTAFSRVTGASPSVWRKQRSVPLPD